MFFGNLFGSHTAGVRKQRAIFCRKTLPLFFGQLINTGGKKEAKRVGEIIERRIGNKEMKF